MALMIVPQLCLSSNWIFPRFKSTSGLEYTSWLTNNALQWERSCGFDPVLMMSVLPWSIQNTWMSIPPSLLNYHLDLSPWSHAHNVFHVEKLLPAYDWDQLLFLTSDGPVANDDPVTNDLGDYYDEEYEVETLISHWYDSKGNLQYKVQSIGQDSLMIPGKHLRTYLPLLRRSKTTDDPCLMLLIPSMTPS